MKYNRHGYGSYANYTFPWLYLIVPFRYGSAFGKPQPRSQGLTSSRPLRLMGREDERSLSRSDRFVLRIVLRSSARLTHRIFPSSPESVIRLSYVGRPNKPGMPPKRTKRDD